MELGEEKFWIHNNGKPLKPSNKVLIIPLSLGSDHTYEVFERGSTIF